MKKLIYGVLVYGLGIILTLLACYHIARNEGWLKVTSETVEVDPSLAEDPACEPIFYNVEDVLMCQSDMIFQQEIDSIFMSLSRESLHNIVTVLLKRNKCVTMKGIVEEYKVHKQIYDALESNKAPSLEPYLELQMPKSKQNPLPATTPDTIPQPATALLPEPHNKDESTIS